MLIKRKSMNFSRMTVLVMLLLLLSSVLISPIFVNADDVEAGSTEDDKLEEAVEGAVADVKESVGELKESVEDAKDAMEAAAKEAAAEAASEAAAAAEAVVEDIIEDAGEAISEAKEGLGAKLAAMKDALLTKKSVKKIAAVAVGAWGATTGVGWATRKFGGGEVEVAPTPE